MFIVVLSSSGFWKGIGKALAVPLRVLYWIISGTVIQFQPRETLDICTEQGEGGIVSWDCLKPR